MTTVTGSRRRMAGAGLAGLALLAALAAGACTKSSATPRIIYVTPPPGPTGTPVTGSPGVTPAPAASPTVTSILIDSTAPDGRWKVTFKKPVIGGVSDTTAAAMNDAITNQINGYIDAFTKSDLPVPAKNASPSTLEGDYSISMNTASIVSLRFSVLTMTSGAAHPVGTPGSISFVASTGKTIALADLFTDPAAAAAKIAAGTHASLSTQLGGDLTWDGKASSLDFFARAWVFTPAGLDFYWPQGQLASMAAGMPSAVVPWAELKPLVKASSPAGAFTK